MNRVIRRISRRRKSPARVTARLPLGSGTVYSVSPASSTAEQQHDDLLALLLQTGAKLQASLDRNFMQYGLTMLDAGIVLHCAESQVTLTPGKLAVALRRDKGKITRVIDRLERECFVTRVASSVDRRKALLKPTKRAKSLAPSLKALFAGIHRQVFAEVNKSDLERLAKTLLRLRKNATGLKRDLADGSKPPNGRF